MQLIQQRQIEYTTPPAPLDAEVIAAIEEIDRKSKPTAQDTAQRAELAATLAPAEQWRFTLATCNAFDLARYQTARRLWPAWLEAQTGAKYRDAIDTDEGLQLAILGDKWARFIGATRKIERRTSDRLDESAGPEWTPIDMPPEWKSEPSAYINAMPAELIEALDQATIALNPGLFVVDMSQAAKKKGGISERK